MKNVSYLKLIILLLLIFSLPLSCAKPKAKDQAQGSPGKDGTNGMTTLVRTLSADPSVCAAGGTIFNSGLDLNYNNVLDAIEVTQVSIVCNGQAAPISQFTPSLPIAPCGPNSSNFKEVLLGLSGGGILAEFTGNPSNAGTVRNALIPDGNYSDTDDSACNFVVATASNNDRIITWSGSSANGSGPYNPGSAYYTAQTMTWTVSY